MKLSELIVGVTTASAYYDKPDGYHFAAEHDQVYLYATERPMSPEDVQKMIENNWFQEHWTEAEDTSDGPNSEQYDHNEPWTAFT